MITIITPTYNRAYTLDRLYNSLVNQSQHDFEWVIIDDGSKDGTGEIVDAYIIENKIDIKYFYQTNMGKPSAINLGVEKSIGEFILIVDSDDALTLDALQVVEDTIAGLKKDNCQFSGVGFRKGTLDGNLIGISERNYGKEFLMLNATECSDHFQGDLAYCFKKSLHLSNPFPRFPNEKFVPELYIWNAMSDVSKIALNPNKIIYLCEYLEDGLSNNFKSQLKKNPKGFGLFYADQFRRDKKIKSKLKKAIRRLQCYIYEYIK